MLFFPSREQVLGSYLQTTRKNPKSVLCRKKHHQTTLLQGIYEPAFGLNRPPDRESDLNLACKQQLEFVWQLVKIEPGKRFKLAHVNRP